MDERIKLRVLGISYNQLQQDIYALLLAQEDGPYRIPIVIGSAEAHSIAMRLEGIIPPRPLTHDLFISFAHSFGVKILEVFIYNFADGIFSAELTFTDGERTVSLDARASDAIAIALRTHAPIFTTPEVLEETGFILETPDDTDDTDDTDELNLDLDGEDFNGDEEVEEDIRTIHDDYIAPPRLENYAIEELERTLQQLVDDENYEEAARVSEILDRKRKAAEGSHDKPNE